MKSSKEYFASHGDFNPRGLRSHTPMNHTASKPMGGDGIPLLVQDRGKIAGLSYFWPNSDNHTQVLIS